VPEQLEMLGYLADEYSRGWAHLTTRQNVQMHFVQLEQTPELLRLLASVDLTTREACGDTVRNVTGCHLAGACPFEVLDISPWAKATTDFFLRNPYAQRMPRKFKINFSGCVTDCGQAMFNDVGVSPDAVQEHGDAPAGAGKGPVTQVGEAPVNFLGLTQYERWENANVVRGRANGTVSAYAYARLGDITSDQFRELAEIQREF